MIGYIGEKAGTAEILTTSLPGLPDNIKEHFLNLTESVFIKNKLSIGAKYLINCQSDKITIRQTNVQCASPLVVPHGRCLLRNILHKQKGEKRKPQGKSGQKKKRMKKGDDTDEDYQELDENGEEEWMTDDESEGMAIKFLFNSK